jgi:hypothetical protein
MLKITRGKGWRGKLVCTSSESLPISESKQAKGCVPIGSIMPITTNGVSRIPVGSPFRQFIAFFCEFFKDG